MDNVIINGTEYAPVAKATGSRAVIVVDRGWIFAGEEVGLVGGGEEEDVGH